MTYKKEEVVFPFVILVISSAVWLFVVALRRPRKRLVHIVVLNAFWITGLLVLIDGSYSPDPVGHAFLGIVLFVFGPLVALKIRNKRRHI